MGRSTFVLGSLALLLVISACNDAGEEELRAEAHSSEASAAVDHPTDDVGSTPRDVSGSRPETDGSATPEVDPAGAEAAVGVEIGVVATVVDGDTFILTDHRAVRVLGIDSCELISRSGSRARDDAAQLLGPGRMVTLRGEPGVDRDRYRRHLRYVTTSGGQDLGSEMIGFAHTGVYEGGDASAAYTAQLRRLDDGPRECTPLPPAASTTSATPTTTTARPTPIAAPIPDPRPAPEPAPEPRPAPRPLAAPAPTPAPDPPPPREAESANCHPSYTPCVPDGPDLDCDEIRHEVIVTGPDEFNLDGNDNDGRGCESYG